MATNKYDRKVLANIFLWPKVYNDACVIKPSGSYHSGCHCCLSPSIYIYHFPLPFLSQAWDTKNKGFFIMIEPGEGWTLLWGFWDASGYMQVMVLPWDAGGRGLLGATPADFPT